MKVLVTGGASLLGRTMVDILGDTHRLRLLDTEPIDTTADSMVGDLRDPQTAFRACEDMEAIVHLCEMPLMQGDPTDWEQDAIDFATRGTYGLFKAAVDAEVKTVVLISTLKLFLKYPEDYLVSESWKPLPDPEDPLQMGKYLAELTAREFARGENILVSCIRVGNVVIEEDCKGLPFDPLWVDARDVAQVSLRMLNIPYHPLRMHRRWWVNHLVPDSPRHRFAQDGAMGAFMGLRAYRTFKAWEDAS